MSENKIEEFKKNPFQYGSQETRDAILQHLAVFFLGFNDLWMLLHDRKLSKEEIVDAADSMEVLRMTTNALIEECIDSDLELSGLVKQLAIQQRNELN